MSFLQNFRLATYALCLLGMLALSIAHFLAPWWLLLPLLSMVMVEKSSWPTLIARIPRAALNAVTLAIFAYCVVVIFIIGEDLIAAGIYFTIYLQCIKILTGKSNRDYFQIYVLAFAQLIVSTLLSNDINFVIPFLGFMILAPWAFTLYNLKQQLEQSADPLVVQTTLRASNIIGKRFFGITALISLLMLLNTMAIFFLFPRVSFGFLFKKINSNQTTSGFSEKVDLNSIGTIKTNDAIVMRVESPQIKNGELAEQLYWRGLAFDEYDASTNQWRRSMTDKTKIDVDIFNGTLKIRELPEAPTLNYDIILEPLPSDVLFAADKLVQLKWNKLQIERMLRRDLSLNQDRYGALYFNSSLQSDRHYNALSMIQAATAADLRQDRDKSAIPPLRLQHYTKLLLPSAKIQELASQLTRDLDNDYDRASQITQYLNSQYSYTLKVPKYESNPIEDFLFKDKRGHCEYFASSAVILLRAAQVPSRLVSGFRGGDWNEMGQYLAVRQRDAHTWVEVWFPEHGWQRFDPTPPDRRAIDFNDLRFAALRKTLEYLELRWYRYIVNYDLQSQYTLAVELWKKTIGPRHGTKLGQGLGNWRQWWQQLRQDDSTGSASSLSPKLALWLLLILFGYLWYSLRQRRQKPLPSYQAVVMQLYQRFIRVAQRHGFKDELSQTPLELAHLAQTKLGDKSIALVELLYRVRFGQRAAKPDELRVLEVWIEELEK